MNLLMVGRGKGSWEIRGHQLGNAMGARVTSTPSDADWHWAERVVFVKRPDPTWIARAHALRIPIVWDPLDFWRQPAENGCTDDRARALLRRQIDMIQPVLVIGATQAMADAAEGIYIPHHARPGLRPTLAHQALQIVGYEGNALYLGRWAGVLQQMCRANGWTFVINPPDLADVDVVAAFRDGPWDGWICREWKSGVKVVNAVAAGRPVLTQATAAFREIQPVGQIVEDIRDLPAALDLWRDVTQREAVVQIATERFRRYGLTHVANEYLSILTGEAVAA
jgi:hypothetical protein